VPFGDHPTSYSQMVSIGMQREIFPGSSYDTNFVFTGGRAEERRQNINSAINPATESTPRARLTTTTGATRASMAIGANDCGNANGCSGMIAAFAHLLAYIYSPWLK